MPKKPTKKQLSDAGKKLQNPRTRVGAVFGLAMSARCSWTRDDLDLGWVDKLVATGDQHGSDGAAVAASAGDSRRFVGEMSVAPLHQREDGNGQLAALLGQPILGARGALAVGASLEDPFPDEPGEAIAEDVRRHAEARLELVEAA